MRKFSAAAGAVAFVLAAGAAQAAVVFEENFDDDAASTTLNFTAFDQFTVVEGSVDYIRSGGFGIGCVGGAGGCVDLDGSTTSTPASRLASTSINFQNGVDYTLSFDLSGNQRGGANDTLRIIIAGLLDETIADIAPGAPFANYSFAFTAGGDLSAAIVFLIAGASDFIGPILDNVRLTSSDDRIVPLPAAAPLMLLGLAGLAGARRRAKSQA